MTHTLWGLRDCVQQDHTDCYCEAGKVWIRIHDGTARQCAKERSYRSGGAFWQDLMVLPTGQRPPVPVWAVS